MEASDSVQSLTAAINGYGLEASDAMQIVDQLTTLDLKFAASSGDIATAQLLRAGCAVMHITINSFNCGNFLRD
jgi:hypothetical protein